MMEKSYSRKLSKNEQLQIRIDCAKQSEVENTAKSMSLFAIIYVFVFYCAFGAVAVGCTLAICNVLQGH